MGWLRLSADTSGCSRGFIGATGSGNCLRAFASSMTLCSFDTGCFLGLSIISKNLAEFSGTVVIGVLSYFCLANSFIPFFYYSYLIFDGLVAEK